MLCRKNGKNINQVEEAYISLKNNFPLAFISNWVTCLDQMRQVVANTVEGNIPEKAERLLRNAKYWFSAKREKKPIYK
jgi:hypothetical protein